MSGDGTQMSQISAHTRAILKALRHNKKNGPLQPYLHKARWIAQSVHPFINIQRVFYSGVPEANLDDENNDEPEEYTDEEIKTFQAIMKLERGFKSVVNACAIDADTYLLLIGQISNAAAHSRSDDTGKLKSDILGYIYEDLKIGSRFPPELQGARLVASDSKALRGFQHIDFADHLCPLKLKADFEQDPMNFMNQVEDGTVEITADDLPSFLYETGTIYNPEDEITGLFRGFLLVRVYRHIFTGPSSAVNPKDRSKNKSKAGIYMLTTTYIALSNMRQWGSSANLFYLDEFYEHIVSIFEDNADTPWVKETLGWWNDQVPGLHRSSGSKKKTRARSTSKTGPSPAQRIAAQLSSRIQNLPITASQHQSPPPHGEDESQYEIVPPNNFNTLAEYEEMSWSDIMKKFDDSEHQESDSDSSTEPESADEDAHGLWEKREQMKERSRQQKHNIMEDTPTRSRGQQQGREMDDQHHDTQWEVQVQGQQGDEPERGRHRRGVHKQGEPGDLVGFEDRDEDHVPVSKKVHLPKPTPIQRAVNTASAQNLKRVRGLNNDLTNSQPEINEPMAKKLFLTTSSQPPVATTSASRSYRKGLGGIRT